MGLTKLGEKAPERSDPASITVAIQGEKLRFRRPTVSDLQPSRELLDKIAASVSGIKHAQVFMCYLLGACYRADPEEGKIEPWRIFAGVAVKNDLLFADICKQWESHFPEFVNFVSAQADAKNDSGAEAKDSDTESPTSLPASINSPESLNP